MRTPRLAVPTFLFAAAVAAQAPPATPAAPAASTAPAARDDRAAEQLGWRLGVQAWTFRDRTAFEAIETARRLGLKYIELYPGQRLRPDDAEAKVAIDMGEPQRQALRQQLERCGVRLCAFGVVELANDEPAARKLFEFGRAMALETITCEPAADAWDLAEKLADEYRLQVACHDHPKPSRYWNPKTVLDAVRGRSPRLGACADTGHWPRSGLDPAACLDLLKGRIVSLHFKDIAPLAADGKDRPWGSGRADAAGMLRQLHQQGFRGLVSIEYEDGSGAELEQNVARCIAFFDRIAGELVAAKAQAPGDGKR